METLVIAVHLMVAVAIIGLILLQQGKGAEMGASFGSGSSQTVFGPQGTGNLFSRATAIFTAVFFATSFWLAIIAKDKVSGVVEEGIPSTEVIEAVEKEALDVDVPVVPAADESDIPVVDDFDQTGDVPQ